MSKSGKDFREYPTGSPEQVIAHGLYKRSRNKGLSMPFLGINNPERAFEVAKRVKDNKSSVRNSESWTLLITAESESSHRLGWRFSYARIIDCRICYISFGFNKISCSIIVSNEKQFSFGIIRGRNIISSSNLRKNRYEEDNDYAHLFSSIKQSSMEGIIAEHIPMIKKVIEQFDKNVEVKECDWRELPDEQLKQTARRIALRSNGSSEKFVENFRAELGYPYTPSIAFDARGENFMGNLWSKDGKVLSF